MQIFLSNLLVCSITMSVISLIYMAATPLLSKRYTAKWRYYVWLVIVLGWIIPYRLHFALDSFSVKVPSIEFVPLEQFTAGDTLSLITNEENRESATTLWWIVGGIWLMGVSSVMVWHVWKHWKFKKMVHRWSEYITDLKKLSVLNTLQTELEISEHVRLKTCPGIISPMLIGFFRPIILLPSSKSDYDELIPILKHELVHLKRRDLWYKLLVLLASALHWFNPMVHIITKEIAAHCEVSCDEAVLLGTNFEERKKYGQIIIEMARNRTKMQTALSTNYYGGKKGFKTRIFLMLDTAKKKTGITIFGMAFIIIIGTKMIFADPFTDSVDEISKEQVSTAPTIKEPPYSNNEEKSNREFLTEAGLLEYDDEQHVYRFHGRWVRTIKDIYIWDGRKYGGISRMLPGNAKNDWGEPIDLKTVRDPQTNKIEKLVEMSKEEAEEIVKDHMSED